MLTLDAILISSNPWHWVIDREIEIGVLKDSLLTDIRVSPFLYNPAMIWRNERLNSRCPC